MLHKRILFILTLCGLFNLTQAQTKFWTETFNYATSSTTPPGGTLANNFVTVNGTWTVNSNLNATNGSTPNMWFISCQEDGHPAGSCASTCTAGTGDPTLHVSANLSGVGDIGASYAASFTSETHDRVESPAINCFGMSGIVLSFNYLLNGEGLDDSCTLDLFDGTTWNSVPLSKTAFPPSCAPKSTWTRYSMLLPSNYTGITNLKIGFKWGNDNDVIGSDPSFAVDSINLYYLSINHSPNAVNDFITTPSNVVVSNYDVMQNDNDPDVTDVLTLNAVIATPPVNGQVSSVNSGGTLTYTPNLNFCGKDSFQYFVCDNGSPTLCDSAWVYITVGSLPSTPTLVTASANPLCLGNNLTLSATGTPGMTMVWTGPAGLLGTGTSVTLPAAALSVADSGKYCVNQFQYNACPSLFACIVVDVNPVPATPIAASNSPVCSGQNCNLTANPNGSTAGTWNWTGPASFNSNLQNPTIPNFGTTQSGNYSVTNTVNGCTSAASTAINVVSQICVAPVSNFSYSPNDTICSGAYITLSDLSTNSPSAWNWNFNATNVGGITVSSNTSNLQNPGIIMFSSSLTTAATLTISLTVSNAVGTSTAFTKTLVVLPGAPLPSISLSANTVCVGNSVVISDASANAPTSWSWIIANANPSTFNGQNPGLVQFNQPGSQLIQLTASNMCGANVATKLITVKTVPAAQFSLNPPYCNAAPIVIYDNSTNSPTSWQWTFGEAGTGNDTSVLQSPSHVYNNPGAYTIQLISWNACGASSPVTNTININDCSAPIANFGIPADTICMNTNFALTDSSLHGPLIYYWAISGASPGTSNTASPVVQFGAPGNYQIKLTVQNPYGTSTKTKTVTVLSCLPPSADFYFPLTICAETCIDFTNVSTQSPYTSLWTFTGSDTSSSTQINPKNICYHHPGTYTISLVDSNKYGKSNIMTKSITVNPAPRILTPNSTIVAGTDITLKAIGTGLITWMPNVALNHDTGNIVISSTLTNTFYTVKDESNCKGPDTVYITVIYKNAELTVPNGFTPDGNGMNDVFRVTANQPLNQFSMRIFNRWGEEVFHTEDYTEGWDGYHRGKEQNSGVYIYIINYQDLGDGEYKVLKGNLTLVR